jgi:glutamine synthetase
MFRCRDETFCLIIDEPSKLSGETRKEMGIVKTLPRTVNDAWMFLLEDKEMVKELGEEFVEAYLAVKKVRLQLNLLISE